MKAVRKSALESKGTLQLLARAVEIMWSAPSIREGIGQILYRIRNRLPATKSTMRQAKTELWQKRASVESFIANTDPISSSAAAYVNMVFNDFFLSHSPPAAKVLDVGCGHGIISIFLAQHGRSVTACDVSELMLEELARRSAGLDIKIRRTDAYDLPFTDNEFDIVVARMFLYQFPDWPKILCEMARCCRRGGRLLIHFTSKENIDIARSSCSNNCDFGDSAGAVRSILVRNSRPELFQGAFDRRTIKNACRRAGLRLVERAPCLFFHYNRLIGYSLGTERFITYNKELTERLKDPQVLEFVAWFEKTVIQRMPEWISHYNVLVLEKV